MLLVNLGEPFKHIKMVEEAKYSPRGKQITNEDDKGLPEYHYTINNCLLNLKLLRHASDLYSTDVLCQAHRQLTS